MTQLFQIESMSSYELVGVGVTKPDASLFVSWKIEIMNLLFQIESMSSYELMGVGVA